MIRYVEYDKVFCRKSWSWINDQEIRYLIDAPLFSKEDQGKWFSNLKDKRNYYIKGVSFNDVPIGSVGLKNITETDGEYWGYIGEKEYWGQGIGKDMIMYILDYASKIQLASVYLKVRKENIRAIKLYEKVGFITKNLEENNLLMIIILGSNNVHSMQISS